MPRYRDTKCIGRGDLFGDQEGETKLVRVQREIAAKAICAVCPHIDECRAWALEQYEPQGVWGGLTVSERRELLGLGRGKRMAKPVPLAEHGTPAGYEAHRRLKEKACDACKLAHREYGRERDKKRKAA